MIVRTKPRKRLGAGVHLVAIKSISIAKDRQTSRPVEMLDAATGQKVGAIDVLLMDADGIGINEQFWLTEDELWKIHALCKAAGIDVTQKIDAKDAINRKVYAMVQKVLLYDNLQPRMDGPEQVWYPRLTHEYFPADTTPFAGEPAPAHKCSIHGEFFPPQEEYSVSDGWE